MKSTFISKEKNDVKFSMEFTAEEFEEAIIKAYQQTKEKYVIDGFRKGKAPRRLIEAHYGEDVFFEDAINSLFSYHYPMALDQLELRPVDSPDADFEELEKGKGFTVNLTVAVMPEVEVKDYSGVKVQKITHEVTDEDVENELKKIQKRNGRMIIAERPAENGDTVLIDYAGYVDDVAFEGGTAERQPLTLGSGTFIPGFEEQLVGAKAGDEIDVKVTFPEQYHSEDLSGKEAVFKCKVHEVKTTELPELNDDFAKDVSEFDTLEELKKDTKEKLEKAAATKSEMDTKNAILEKVYEANEVDIPNAMVESQIDEMMQEFDQQLRYQGMDLENYFKYLKREPKEFREELRGDAYKKIKTRLLVEAVADAEKLEASEEEIEKELQAMADQYKMELEKLREMMGTQNYGMLEKDIKMRKAVDFMFEKAVFE